VAQTRPSEAFPPSKEQWSRLSSPLILLAIDVATVVCAVLLAARVLVSRPKLKSAWLVALMALAMACGALLGRQDYSYWIPSPFRVETGGWAGLLDFARNLTPGLFMLLCFTLFTDRRRFPRWLLALMAVQLILDEPGRALIPSDWRYARFATQTAPALLETIFAGFAFYWTVADWRFDLVETRRAIRVLIMAVGGGLIVVSGLAPLLIDPNSIANYHVHEAVAVADLAILALVLFRMTGGDVGRYLDFEPTQPTAQAASAINADLPALARLTALLEEEHVCEREGLSLKALAGLVGVPEYRLRKLIHEQLGYRNFNALLHDYRIREACRQLSDPALRRTPILTIALSVGYASINTFSRGFREITGVTPSAWREGQLEAGGTSGAAPRGQ
jgi:AraC-like DNA-binding protein